MDCFNRFILKLLITGSLKAYMLTKSGLEFNQQNKTVGTSSDARPWPIVSTLAAKKKNPWSSIHVFRRPCELRELLLSHHTQDLIPIHTIERLDVLGSFAGSASRPFRESHAAIFHGLNPRNKKWMLFSQFMVNSWWELVGGENDHGISL